MVVILSDKSGKVFLCLLSALSFAFCQDCDIDDLICTNAVKFSQRAKQRCREKWVPICRNDASQLRKRFLARFIRSAEYEAACDEELDEKNLLKDCTPKPDKRKKRELMRSIRRKRQDPFQPIFYWHQDNPIDNCCVTTRRTIPYRRDCGRSCFVVFCPVEGGYQWIDQVKCNVNEEMAKELGVDKISKQKCRKRCTTYFTKRTYLVTNIAPRGFFGHCFEHWLPVWFRVVDVPSHCVCQR